MIGEYFDEVSSLAGRQPAINPGAEATAANSNRSQVATDSGVRNSDVQSAAVCADNQDVEPAMATPSVDSSGIVDDRRQLTFSNIAGGIDTNAPPSLAKSMVRSETVEFESSLDLDKYEGLRDCKNGLLIKEAILRRRREAGVKVRHEEAVSSLGIVRRRVEHTYRSSFQLPDESIVAVTHREVYYSTDPEVEVIITLAQAIQPDGAEAKIDNGVSLADLARENRWAGLMLSSDGYYDDQLCMMLLGCRRSGTAHLQEETAESESAHAAAAPTGGVSDATLASEIGLPRPFEYQSMYSGEDGTPHDEGTSGETDHDDRESLVRRILADIDASYRCRTCDANGSHAANNGAISGTSDVHLGEVTVGRVGDHARVISASLDHLAVTETRSRRRTLGLSERSGVAESEMNLAASTAAEVPNASASQLSNASSSSIGYDSHSSVYSSVSRVSRKLSMSDRIYLEVLSDESQLVSDAEENDHTEELTNERHVKELSLPPTHSFCDLIDGSNKDLEQRQNEKQQLQRLSRADVLSFDSFEAASQGAKVEPFDTVDTRAIKTAVYGRRPSLPQLVTPSAAPVVEQVDAAGGMDYARRPSLPHLSTADAVTPSAAPVVEQVDVAGGMDYARRPSLPHLSTADAVTPSAAPVVKQADGAGGKDYACCPPLPNLSTADEVTPSEAPSVAPVVEQVDAAGGMDYARRPTPPHLSTADEVTPSEAPSAAPVIEQVDGASGKDYSALVRQRARLFEGSAPRYSSRTVEERRSYQELQDTGLVAQTAQLHEAHIKQHEMQPAPGRFCLDVDTDSQERFIYQRNQEAENEVRANAPVHGVESCPTKIESESVFLKIKSQSTESQQKLTIMAASTLAFPPAAKKDNVPVSLEKHRGQDDLTQLLSATDIDNVSDVAMESNNQEGIYSVEKAATDKKFEINEEDLSNSKTSNQLAKRHQAISSRLPHVNPEYFTLANKDSATVASSEHRAQEDLIQQLSATVHEHEIETSNLNDAEPTENVQSSLSPPITALVSPGASSISVTSSTAADLPQEPRGQENLALQLPANEYVENKLDSNGKSAESEQISPSLPTSVQIRPEVVQLKGQENFVAGAEVEINVTTDQPESEEDQFNRGLFAPGLAAPNIGKFSQSEVTEHRGQEDQVVQMAAAKIDAEIRVESGDPDNQFSSNELSSSVQIQTSAEYQPRPTSSSPPPSEEDTDDSDEEALSYGEIPQRMAQNQPLVSTPLATIDEELMLSNRHQPDHLQPTETLVSIRPQSELPEKPTVLMKPSAPIFRIEDAELACSSVDSQSIASSDVECPEESFLMKSTPALESGCAVPGGADNNAPVSLDTVKSEETSTAPQLQLSSAETTCTDDSSGNFPENNIEKVHITESLLADSKIKTEEMNLSRAPDELKFRNSPPSVKSRSFSSRSRIKRIASGKKSEATEQKSDGSAESKEPNFCGAPSLSDSKKESGEESSIMINFDENAKKSSVENSQSSNKDFDQTKKTAKPEDTKASVSPPTIRKSRGSFSLRNRIRKSASSKQADVLATEQLQRSIPAPKSPTELKAIAAPSEEESRDTVKCKEEEKPATDFTSKTAIKSSFRSKKGKAKLPKMPPDDSKNSEQQMQEHQLDQTVPIEDSIEALSFSEYASLMQQSHADRATDSSNCPQYEQPCLHRAPCGSVNADGSLQQPVLVAFGTSGQTLKLCATSRAVGQTETFEAEDIAVVDAKSKAPERLYHLGSHTTPSLPFLPSYSPETESTLVEVSPKSEPRRPKFSRRRHSQNRPTKPTDAAASTVSSPKSPMPDKSSTLPASILSSPSSQSLSSRQMLSSPIKAASSMLEEDEDSKSGGFQQLPAYSRQDTGEFSLPKSDDANEPSLGIVGDADVSSAVGAAITPLSSLSPARSPSPTPSPVSSPMPADFAPRIVNNSGWISSGDSEENETASNKDSKLSDSRQIVQIEAAAASKSLPRSLPADPFGAGAIEFLLACLNRRQLLPEQAANTAGAATRPIAAASTPALPLVTSLSMDELSRDRGRVPAKQKLPQLYRRRIRRRRHQLGGGSYYRHSSSALSLLREPSYLALALSIRRRRDTPSPNRRSRSRGAARYANEDTDEGEADEQLDDDYEEDEYSYYHQQSYYDQTHADRQAAADAWWLQQQDRSRSMPIPGPEADGAAGYASLWPYRRRRKPQRRRQRPRNGLHALHLSASNLVYETSL